MVKCERMDFVWNGQNLASETKNGTTTSYTYDPTGVILSNNGTDITRFIKDPHGNVVATSKNDSIIGTYDYTAFGNQLENTDSSNPFRYCGEYYDTESGLVYLRNRYYDSATGRFITEDPIRDGLNWYSYCAGNPICYTDSLGLWMDGDELLSQGAQTYTTYYGEKWQEAFNSYCTYMANHNGEGAQIAKAEMDKWHQKAEDIRELDSEGKVAGKTLAVPLYNQKDTFPHDDSNSICWACCHAMMTSFYLNDNIDRTLNVASYTDAFIIPLNGTPINYNKACFWISTDKLYFGVDKSQTQIENIISMDEIMNIIGNNDVFAVLYGEYNEKEEWSGHWVLGIGAAQASDHVSLVLSNDPNGGVRRIQSYDEFRGNYVGDPIPWRPWAETAK